MHVKCNRTKEIGVFHEQTNLIMSSRSKLLLQLALNNNSDSNTEKVNYCTPIINHLDTSISSVYEKNDNMQACGKSNVLFKPVENLNDIPMDFIGVNIVKQLNMESAELNTVNVVNNTNFSDDISEINFTPVQSDLQMTNHSYEGIEESFCNISNYNVPNP